MGETGDRVRGFVLYGAAAVLLAGGGTWFYRAAPDTGPDPRFARWHAKAEDLLPNGPSLTDSATVDLAAGADRTIRTNVSSGFYQVAAVCVGDTGSSLRMSVSDESDTDRNLDCAGGSTVTSFAIGADTLLLHVMVGTSGPVTFRYTVIRQLG